MKGRHLELRAEEKWAQYAMANELGVLVEQYDDNTKPRMYDLAFTTARGEAGAEVIQAAAERRIRTQVELAQNHGYWECSQLRSSWRLGLSADVDLKQAETIACALLTTLELEGTDEFGARGGLQPKHERMAAEGGITGAIALPTTSTPRIYPHLDCGEHGGYLTDDTNPLVQWVGEFLGSDSCADVRHKLSVSGHSNRHAFILLPLETTAPFEVAQILTRVDAPIPTQHPRLPDSITHVWVMSLIPLGHGLRWDPQLGWKQFRSSPPPDIGLQSEARH